ncbi:hypothetical protein BDV24DRAFT_172694 [Aspergillus arachidicola]|uniref:Uncharacterized protein n=1 Tax=Aspergillus arachidicola TaxID=656916 RepID=A0A5N6XME3_9EURO|nr:hypothetical protein BDV24DRAFT_172694 [Aspergillus arachidicola]
MFGPDPIGDIHPDVLVLHEGQVTEGASDAEGENDVDVEEDIGNVPDSDVEIGDVEQISRRSAERTLQEDPSAAGSLSLPGPADRFPDTAGAEGQPVIASPAVPLTPEDSARQEVLAEHLVEQLIRYQGCGHSQEEPGPIPEDQAGPLSPPAVPTVQLSEVIQKEYSNILFRDGITAYSPEWNKYFPVDRRRRLFTGVETIYIEDGGPGKLPGVYFNVDSAGGFALSLAVARQGLYWVGVQLLFQDGDSGRWWRDRRPVHRISYLPLGRMCGFESVEIYVLFPRLYHPTRKSFMITKDEYTLWMNEVFLPALHAIYSESILQNLPVSAADTQARYGLRPELLDSLWQGVSIRIDGQGLAQFRGMKLLLTGKNLKSCTQGPSWAAAQARFFAIYRLAREEPGPPATFFSWRRCCLERFSHWLEEVAAAAEGGALSTALDPIEITAGPSQRAGPPGSDHDSDGDMEYIPEKADRKGAGAGAVGEGPRPAQVKRRWRQEMYSFSLTRDMAILTIEPTHQYYNSRKVLFAAGNHYVFSNPALDTLALDKGLIQVWQHVGRAVSHFPMALLRAYRYTKRRVREEYRVSRGLLWAELHVPRASADPSTDPAPSHLPFFCHRTDLILRWLRWNINKFCLGFEIVYSLRPQIMVQWEHTRVMIIFLCCLLFVYRGQGAHPRRCNRLWLDRRVRPAADGSEREWIDEGLGMEQALERYGYAWLPDHKINWASITFRPPHRVYMSFNTPILLAAYHSHYRTVLSTYSDFLLFHDMFARIYSLREDHPRSALLLQLLVDLCLRAFRKDIFTVLAERSRTTQPVYCRQMEVALAGEVPLTILGLWRVFQRRPLGDDFRFGWQGNGNNGNYNRCFDTIAQVLPYPSNRLFCVHPSLVEYYRATEPTDPANIPYLLVSGWQRSQGPILLDIALPPIPTNLDAYLAAVADPARPDTDLDIPLPAIGVLDGPIQRYILDHTPEKRILRSYQRKEATALITHLENQVRVLRDIYLQRQRDLSIPFWRCVDSESLQYLFTAPAKVLEEDSDSENIRNKHTRAEKKYYRCKKDLRNTRSLVREFIDLRQEMKIIKKTTPSIINLVETVYKRANQIQEKLAVISKRVIEEPVEL